MDDKQYDFDVLIDTINKTRMQKSYKMGLLLSFVKGNTIARKLSLEELARDFRKTYAQEPYSFDLSDPSNKDLQNWSLERLINFIKKNPIEHLEAPFFLIDGFFELRLEHKYLGQPEYAHKMRVAIESRLDEYFEARYGRRA